jgi:predicted TIM-barrel fold metal-dependent hydrolase
MNGLEVVDAQVHLNRLGAGWQTADPHAVIERAIVAMDAVGVDAVLIGEYAQGPGAWRTLPNGARRRDYPFSELAVQLHPDRFAYHVGVDRRDPELDQQMAAVRSKPNSLCIRVVPLPATGEIEQFAQGAYEPIWAAAEKYDVPLFVCVPGNIDTLVPYLEKFPRAQVIMDHTATLYAGETTPVTDVAARFAEFDHVISLAHFPNLALKWCHAPDRISAEGYPFNDLAPYARRLIDAFGAERVMWASDVTQVQHHYSWAEALHHLLEWRILSHTEAEWIFGKSIRKILRWPKSSSSVPNKEP